MRHDDPDETEGRRLYRARADKLARVQMNIAKRRVRLMTILYQLARDVTREECPWLAADVKKGTIVHDYRGYTYGCIGPVGCAVTSNGELPFFELPYNALAPHSKI